MADGTAGGRGGDARPEGDERARAAGEQTSSAVRLAADVLEEELSAGIQEARRLQQKLTEQRRLEPGDLEEVAARVRRNAHQLIDMVAERFGDLRADDVQELGQRFARDAHEVFDSVMDLVDSTPDVVNRLVERADTMTRPGPESATTAAPAARKTTARASAAKKTAGRKTTAAKSAASKAAASKSAPRKAAATTGKRTTPRRTT